MSYDSHTLRTLSVHFSLNPFGTGQCLTTEATHYDSLLGLLSQSLWNRAMPYDKGGLELGKVIGKSQSLWNRAMPYDRSGVLEPCGTRLTRATSQLFPRLR